MDFSQKFQMQWYLFVILIWFLTVSCIQWCFHWLSNPIRSGVMADQRFTGGVARSLEIFSRTFCLKWVFENSLPWYCYATKSISRIMRSQVSQRESANEGADMSELYSGFNFSHYDLPFPTRCCILFVRSGLYQLVIRLKGFRVSAHDLDSHCIRFCPSAWTPRFQRVELCIASARTTLAVSAVAPS